MSEKKVTKKKCPQCGKMFKNVASHVRWVHEGKRPNAAQPATNQEENIVEGEFVDTTTYLPPFAGEIGKLEYRARHDPSRDWAAVKHAYVKKSGFADTRSERRSLRKQVGEMRLRGGW